MNTYRLNISAVMISPHRPVKTKPQKPYSLVCLSDKTLGDVIKNTEEQISSIKLDILFTEKSIPMPFFQLPKL